MESVDFCDKHLDPKEQELSAEQLHEAMLEEAREAGKKDGDEGTPENRLSTLDCRCDKCTSAYWLAVSDNLETCPDCGTYLANGKCPALYALSGFSL